jgi:hypothetical protein
MTSNQNSQSSDAVHQEYTRRLAERRSQLDHFAALDRSIANGRLLAFLIMVVGLYPSVGRGLFSPWWLVLPAAASLVLIVLIVRHDCVIKEVDRLKRAVAFYESGLRRLEDRWAGFGSNGSRFSDASHPYAEDLDLFGRGSLFELLCTARTRAGEERLASWLKEPAPPNAVRARQEAVEELKGRLDLREDLAVLGEEVRSGVNPDLLEEWGKQPVRLTSQGLRWVGVALSASTIVGLGWWIAGRGPILFYILLILEQGFAGILGARVRQVVKALDKPAQDLSLLSDLLARLEREPFRSPLLQELLAALDMQEVPPSKRIARLQTLKSYLDARRNVAFAPIGGILLWTTQLAFSIEKWRGENGPHFERWLRVAGEFEAICALSGYAFEHPENSFPEIIDAGALFFAEGMAHPLLPVGQAVLNDIQIDESHRLYIVSGSNMSGKSTLLRTIGTNVVLALAGASAPAARLSLSPLHLGASIRTQDSLQAGISRFYAEIKRLRQVVEIANTQPPLLFLLDEILHGTNSHDRRVGAEAVVRALIRQGAVGLITTHDLAITAIAEDTMLSGVNVHFEDQLEDGQMTFDYHLRPGVVEKSNAIELMRAVGLEV